MYRDKTLTVGETSDERIGNTWKNIRAILRKNSYNLLTFIQLDRDHSTENTEEIAKLKKSSSGPDTITNDLSPALRKSILEVYNDLWNLLTYPDEWKETNIVSSQSMVKIQENLQATGLSVRQTV
ncbi:hypothetical protein HHI36_014992 [Cryptolaemus montrouzieri]|uniref:Uncharacterized protein n=1 Tax=Cryptolaemus montrouzieri TaxID=559131 RepID=A0ABD2N4C7_9CUCU